MDDDLVEVAARAVAGLSSAQLGCPIYDSDKHAIARAVLAAVIGPIYAQALEAAADECEALGQHACSDEYLDATQDCAYSIRALKGAGGATETPHA